MIHEDECRATAGSIGIPLEIAEYRDHGETPMLREVTADCINLPNEIGIAFTHWTPLNKFA